jgi:hypothetical protein
MLKIIGKIPPNLIQPELDVNNIIKKDIRKFYTPIANISRGMFNLRLVEKEENLSRLDLKDQPLKIFHPAFKLLRFGDIRSVDFTNLGLQDDHMLLLCEYLRKNPNLKSVVLNNNLFTDDGLTRIANELRCNNNKLAHLSIKGCVNITDEGLR